MSVLLPPGEGGRRPDEGSWSRPEARNRSSAASRHLLPGEEGLTADFAILLADGMNFLTKRRAPAKIRLSRNLAHPRREAR